MKKLRFLSLLFLLSVFLGGQSYAQGFLKKIQNKVEEKTIKKALKDDSENTKANGNNSNQSNAGNSQSPKSGTRPVQNTEGGGLVTTPPDVTESIKSASTAFLSKNYGDARYSVRQAIMGVEMEMGQNILKSLPDKVDNLPKVAEEDQVNGRAIGFEGMSIGRVYRTENKELSIKITNDAAILNLASSFAGLEGYGNLNNDKNEKDTKFKDYRAKIRFDQSTGYTLNVPFGQTSLLVVNGINYKNETEFMSAANQFDIEKIKTDLGEK